MFPTRHSFQVEHPQDAPNGFSRITAFMLFFPRFPTISRHFPRFPGPPTPLGKGSHAARSLLSCTLWSGIGRLWRGMGGGRPPRRQHGLLGFHQPRDTQRGFSLFLQRLQGEQPQTRPTEFSRITSHGLYAVLAAFLRVVERHGAAMARHGRHIVPEPVSARRSL